MLISVIVPVYNVESYLNKCIDSILEQSLDDFEIILVDDGSSDSSCEICDKYAEGDPRVKVIHKQNGGVSSARNIGIAAAKGEYICFVDSDDWLENDYFASVEEILRCEKPKLLLNIFVKDFGSKIINEFCYHEKFSITNKEAIWEIINRRIVGWEPVASFYEVSLCKQVKFDQNICFGEYLLFKYCFINKVKGNIMFQPLAKYHYYIRPGSACTSYSVAKKVDDLKVFEKIMAYEENSVGNLLYCRHYVPRIIRYRVGTVQSDTAEDSLLCQYLLDTVKKKFR